MDPNTRHEPPADLLDNDREKEWLKGAVNFY